MAKPWEETYAQPETKKPWELSYASQEPEELPTRSVGAFAKDVGTSLEKGVIGAEQGIVGLLDIPTGGHVGKYLQEHGFDFEKNQKILSEQYSPQQKAENKALEEAHGVMGTIEAALRNPTAVGALLGESAPSIFAGGLLGKVAKVAKGVSVAGAAGIGEGLIAAGGAEENIRNQSEDGLVSGKGTLAAIGTGIGTGVLGALGSKLTTALGGIDADTLLIGGARRALAAEVGVEAATSPNVFKRVVTSALGEGVFEEAPQSAQEQMWQNYATDKPLMEGVPESATKGALLGSIMGGAVGLLPSAQAPKPLTDEGERKEEPLTPLTPQAAAVVKKNDLKAVGLGPEHPQHAEMMKQDFSTPEGIAAAEAFVQGNSEKLGGINDDAWNKLIAKSKERVGVVEQASVVEEVKAPVVEEVKAPVVEEVKAPIVEPITTPAAKAPRVKKVKAEVAPVEEVKAPVVKEVKAPVVKEVKAPVVKEVKAPVEEEVKAPVEEEVKAPVVKEVKSSEPIQIDEAKVTAYDSALERASVLAEGGSKGAARPFMKSLVAQGLISAAQLKKYGNDAPLTELMQAVNTDLQTGRETTLTTPVTPTKIIPHTEFGVKTTKATPIKEKDLTGVERRQQAADVLRAKVEAKKAEIERLETERLAELARIRQDTRDKLALEKTTKKATTSKTTTKPIATSSAAEENEIIKQADENESDDDIMSEQRDDFYFSVAPTSATTGHTAASISKSLSPEMKALVASGKAVIHDTAEGLNKVVPGNHPANVQGLTTKEGVTHYVANKLTPHTMQGVALHEAGVHAGLRKMVGEKVWADITDQAANNPHPTHEAARKAVPKNTPDHLKAEEALAYLVQNSPHMPVVRRLISAIRNWARTTFGANIKLTESDARHLAMKSLRKESKATERTARKETAFSKEKLLAPNGKPSKLNSMQPETPEAEGPKYSVAQEDYHGEHKAPNAESGAPLHDITKGGEIYPDDVYSPKGLQYYGTGQDQADKESFNVIKNTKDKPDAMVTMYRAVPKDSDISTINNGDWVSLSKTYAKEHGESALNDDYKIISQKVKANELFTNGDSINEFGYFKTSKISDNYPNATAAQKERLDMTNKEAAERSAKLTEGARQIERGEITHEDYQKLVDENKPVTAYNYVPKPESNEDMWEALSGQDKKDKLNAHIEEGKKVNVRLDIPAYTNANRWIPTIHEGAKTIAHRSTSIINNVIMKLKEKPSLAIATRKPVFDKRAGKEIPTSKTPIATMEGEWENHTPEQAEAEAKQAMDEYNKGEGDWRQVGMDPERHSYFYDRETQEPITSADRVIQIGALVLAKNAQRGAKAKTDYIYSAASSRATTRYTAEQLSQTLSPEMRKLVSSGKAVLHDTQATLPGENHPANVQGMTTADGVTHYVANKLTPESMQNVALHEVGVHAGMEKMLGAKMWDDVKKQAMNNQGKEFDAARAAVPKNTPANLRAEETLAYLVENSRHLPLVRRIIAAIRNFMRTTFGANIKLTEADARQLAVTSMRRESKTSERTARKETAFSKEKLLAPNGKPSNLNPMQHAQVRTPEFKEWFGDWENDPENASKVVDENGEPKIVYHGTGADISIFDPTKTRIVDGVFFAPDPEHASSYAESFGNLGGKAPNVISAYINVRTPTIIKGVDFDFDSINSAYSDHTNDGAAIIEDDGEIHSFIVWEPNQIKSAIGNTGAFSAENDDIRYSLSSTEQASVAAGEARRAGGPASAPKIGAIENIKKSAASIGTKVFSADARYIRTLRDSLEAIGLPFKDIQPLLLRSSQSQTLNVVSLAERAAVLGGLKKNSDSHIWDAVDDPHKVVNIRHMVEDIAKEKGESYDSVNSIFHDLMVARRIDEVAKRAEKIIATYKGMANVTEKDKAKRLEYANKNRKHVKLAKGLHGYMGKEEVKIHLALLKSDPAYAPLIDEWQAVRKNTIQFLVDTGRYSEEQAATYMDAVAYVPFQRVLEGGEDVDVLYVASTNRHGGKGGLSAGQVEYSLKGQSKREVDDIVSNIEKWVVNSYVKGVKADKSRELIDLADMYLPAGAVEEVGVSSGNKTTVTCYRNGVKEHWKFKDPMMTFAFDSVNPIALQALTVGAKSANILRASIVLDPIFTIAQLPQDTFSAMFTSGVKWPFMLPYEAAKEFTGTLLGPLVGRTTEAHKILKETGAVGGKDFSEKYARSIHDTAYNIKDSGHGIGAKAMQLLNHIAMSGDNAVRQAVYIRTMKELKGNPNAEAIAKDRAFEIINFKRKGASAALDALRQVTPFLGAYLQVQRVAYNTLSGRGISPVSKAEARRTLVSTAAQVTALSIATSVIMRLGDTGDEDDYAKRSLKERFAHIYMNKSMAIPIRNDIFSWPTVLVDYGFSRFVDKSNVDAANAALGESFRRTVLGVPAGPTLIKPILESMMNHDWFTNRPIVPQRLQDRETEFQFNESTSDFSKLVGKSGLISPMLLDHLIKGTTGYAGAAMLSIFDIANRMATNAPYMDKGFYGKTIRDIPGVASMVPKEHFSQDIDTSFALREELDKAATTHKVLKGELNNPEKARQYKAEHRAELSTGAQSRKNSLVSDIDDLNKKIRKLSNTSNEVMSPTTKQERREVLEGRVRHKQGLLSKLYDRVNPN